jgi:CRISPR/Cas system CMR subunit Cmr6 (Cas7 group RAMP superfamily)
LEEALHHSQKRKHSLLSDGKPAIPASSLKGAFRYQLEQILINKKNELKSELGLNNADLLKPCIPAPKPSEAEKQLLNFGYRITAKSKLKKTR